jgi:hypothetical protein
MERDRDVKEKLNEKLHEEEAKLSELIKDRDNI